MPDRDTHYRPEVLMKWIQETGATVGQSFARGEIDEEQYWQALATAREYLTAELLRTIEHLRLRTGREVRDA